MATERLLARIGLERLPDPDLDGLISLHRAFLTAVPYEDLAVQLGEAGPLDDRLLLERLARDGRGGYCFELNTVMAALLRAAGFTVTHHEAVVGGEGPTNHMALVVDVGGTPWLADAGMGEGFLDPLPLRPGEHTVGSFTYTLAREPGGWRLGQHEWGSITGFRMASAPSVVADFEPHHRRLTTDPSSAFVQTLVVQRPYDDRVVTLRARTLTTRGPAVDAQRVLADRGDFAATLRDVFGITLAGARLERAWELAAAQHEAFLARV